jgi:YVTN family beta-propeller protein
MASIEITGPKSSRAGRGGARAGQAACLGLFMAAAGCGASSGGSTPPAETFGPPGTIYVSMYGDDNVTAFDQVTHAVLKKYAVGKGPAVLVATPDGQKLYTANWSDNSISAIDLATGAVKAIMLDGRPWAIAMSPDGKKVWAGLASNKLVAIDTASDAIATTYDTSPNFPESVVVSTDGSQVYIDPASTTSASALGPGQLESVSATDGSVVKMPITVGETPAFLSVSTDGTRAYTLNFLAGTVSVVDTAGWQVISTVDTGSGSQPIISSSTKDNLLIVTNFGTGNLMTVDFQTNEVVHTLALDGRPVGVGGYNADGTVGYVCDFGHASLGVQETLALSLQFLQGDLTPFSNTGPGHLSMFNPATGEKIGTSMTVGKGPTSVLVITP